MHMHAYTKCTYTSTHVHVHVCVWYNVYIMYMYLTPFHVCLGSIPYTETITQLFSRWLQPDRAVDPEASELNLPSDPPVTGLPSEFTITTRDQDGKMVYVGDMKVWHNGNTFA